MKHDDMMKPLRKAALVLPVVALPVFSTPAHAQGTDAYKVVINHEEQYSIWPAERENPLGWSDVGKTGSKDDCHDYIEEVWTDMRPLSLRKKMKEQGLARDEPTYKVVINHEEQYSIWLVNQKLTDTWRNTDKTCMWKDCMSYIEEVWTDMRPLSLRKK